MPRVRSVLYMALLVARLLHVPGVTPQTALAQTPQPEAPPVATGQVKPTSVFEDVITTRTPVPTVTPGQLQQSITEATESVGLNQAGFLGLTAADWINLLISLLMVLAAYGVGTLLIRRLLPRAVERIPGKFDDRALQTIGSDLRWLVVILILQYATARLTFLGATTKSLLSDVTFVLALAVSVLIVFRLLDLADQWYRERLDHEMRLDELDAALTLLVRVARVIVIVAGLGILLDNFGVNVSAFAAALGLGGLAFSLAARDTIADAISGFIILVDRPFRIGDRIEIQEIGTWGDVTDIGLRTTRIRTRDNRMVIVPNSTIGSNQVINYTYPDPRYRVQTHVSVAYGTEVESVRKLLVDTVRQVEGVLPDKPVDALYIEMGDSAMVFRVRWWIESYIDTRQMYDRVHTALQTALDEAGIESPFPTQTINLRTEGQSTEKQYPEITEAP